MPLLENLFRRIDSAKQQQAVTGWDGYKRLLVKLAQDADSADPAEVQAALDEFEKTREELEKDVQLMQQRMQWREQYEQKPELERTIAEQEYELVEAQQEYRAAQQKYFAKSEPLLASLNTKQAQLGECNRCEIHLAQSCLNPQIFAAEKELTEQRQRLVARQRQLQFELDPGNSPVRGGNTSAAYRLGDAKQKLERFVDDNKYDQGRYDQQAIKTLRQNIQVLEEKLGRCRDELAGIAKEQAKLDQQQAAINEQRLEL